jgi:hypothetical protein
MYLYNPAWAAIVGGTISGVAITNSTIDSSVIGGITPAAGTFTTLAGSSVRATNGIFFNDSTINANTTIAAGTNGLSVGPMTLASGVVVTVASGQRWVTL